MPRKRRTPETPSVSGFLGSQPEVVSHAMEALLQKQAGEGSARKSSPEQSRRDASIIALSTESQHGAQTEFDRQYDALALVIGVDAGDENVPGLLVNANFQIVDYETNEVVWNSWSKRLVLKNQRSWITLGNNYGPEKHNYSTAVDWGLWEGVYVFRGVVQIVETRRFLNYLQPHSMFRVF